MSDISHDQITEVNFEQVNTNREQHLSFFAERVGGYTPEEIALNVGQTLSIEGLTETYDTICQCIADPNYSDNPMNPVYRKLCKTADGFAPQLLQTLLPNHDITYDFDRWHGYGDAIKNLVFQVMVGKTQVYPVTMDYAEVDPESIELAIAYQADDLRARSVRPIDLNSNRVMYELDFEGNIVPVEN